VALFCLHELQRLCGGIEVCALQHCLVAVHIFCSVMKYCSPYFVLLLCTGHEVPWAGVSHPLRGLVPTLAPILI
jgi:hypothetical protein